MVTQWRANKQQQQQQQCFANEPKSKQTSIIVRYTVLTCPFFYYSIISRHSDSIELIKYVTIIVLIVCGALDALLIA